MTEEPSAVKLEEKEPDPTDIIEPPVANRPVKIGIDPLSFDFVQRPLNFFQKLEVFSLLGGALNKAMQGPDGITVSELIDGPGSLDGSISEVNIRDANVFIQAIAKLVQYAPELLADLYMVVLSVPRGNRDLVKDMMERPVDEGGLSDEDGFAILDTFIDQNWNVMIDFFTQRILPLANKVGAKVQESQPSTPSKNTQQATPKQ